MLSQIEADNLMALPKKMTTNTIELPSTGNSARFDILSVDDHQKFLLDINRKSTIKLTKCGYQERYNNSNIILVRLDINGPPHTNPDGAEVPGDHIHIYKENYDTRWAYPLSMEQWQDTTDLAICLESFLRYCNVIWLPNITQRLNI